MTLTSIKVMRVSSGHREPWLHVSGCRLQVRNSESVGPEAFELSGIGVWTSFYTGS